MRELVRLTDLHQVTKISYDSSTGRVHMWTEYDPRHRRLLPLRRNITDMSGFMLVLYLIETVTGRVFVPDPEHNSYYREDTEEGRMLIQASIANPYEANA